jgi:pimeloyl-ACP methyl ester carboxylesterase
VPLIRVGQRNIYYEIHGEHPRTPLLLLQGIAGSCRGWLPLQVPFFSKSLRTLITDLRGVGQSEDPGGPFTIADLADDTAAFLDALGIERAQVLGTSMGGMVAQELALRHPQRVEKLILVGTYARPDARRRLLLEHWKDLTLSNLPIAYRIRERLVWTLQDETLEQRDLIDAMVEFYTREGDPYTPDLFARQCDACLAHDTLERLHQIQQRTLVLCGRQDAFTPPKLHRQLADEIPRADLVTLASGAHLVMAESARAFNDVVLRFLTAR